METMIRPVASRDSSEVALIYNHYVLNSHNTFETETVSDSEMQQRINDTLAVALPWFVSITSGKLTGYAYASTWKGRCAYRFSVESTVYIDPAYTGKGIGLSLYSELIEAIRKRSLHVVIGSIALPNEQSIRLHERLGFKKVGHFEQLGYKLDRWVDVGYWQLIL